MTVAKLTAPFTPFVADELFCNLTGPDESAPDSVHLADWPRPDGARMDDGLRAGMALARRLCGLGRAARTEARVRVRQPLARAVLVVPAAEVSSLEGLEGIVADELNVKRVELARGLEELVSYSVKPNFRTLGPRFGARVKEVVTALAASDSTALVSELEDSGEVKLKVAGEEIGLSAEDLDVRLESRPGLALAREGPYGVALDLELTEELYAEGMAREVVRAVQDLRKASGLAVEDRIELWLSAPAEPVAGALGGHSDAIAAEVLASAVHLGRRAPVGAAVTELRLEAGPVTIGLRRSAPGAA